MLGMVHSIESFGSADGPGVRFVVFLQGCAMRCRYCHNPDTWRLEGGTPMSADELLDRAERYRPYWGDEGGITVSGGEALLQLPFVAELFSKARSRGIGTCLDTALQPYREDRSFLEAFDRALDDCDVVMADIKHIDPQTHRDLTGHGNANILAGIRHVGERNVRLWIRYVLVPGVTDDPAALRRTADFIATVPTVERVDVLPYHTLGIYKWDELGVPYTLRDVDPPSTDAVARAEAILRAGVMGNR